MSDTTLTVGADASAYTKTLKEIGEETKLALTDIGHMFMGVQGLASLGAGVPGASRYGA